MYPSTLRKRAELEDGAAVFTGRIVCNETHAIFIRRRHPLWNVPSGYRCKSVREERSRNASRCRRVDSIELFLRPLPAHDSWRNNSEALPTSPLVLPCFLPVTRRVYGHSSPQHRSTIASIAAPPARLSRKNQLIGRSRNMEFAIDTMRRKDGLKYRAIRWEGRLKIRILSYPSPDVRAILPPPKILVIFEYRG